MQWQIQNASGAIAGAWVVGAGLIGVVANVTSIGAAAAVLGVALLPPLFLLVRVERLARPILIRR